MKDRQQQTGAPYVDSVGPRSARPSYRILPHRYVFYAPQVCSVVDAKGWSLRLATRNGMRFVKGALLLFISILYYICVLCVYTCVRT